MAVAFLTALGACSSKTPSDEIVGDGTVREEDVAWRVPCALADAKTFTAVCTVEHTYSDGKEMLIVRHPDGGFRRLIELEGGKGYATIDGSDAVAIEPNGKEIEVTVADDHYLFPAPAPNPQPSGAPASSNAPHP